MPIGPTLTECPPEITVGVYLIDLRQLNDTEQSFEADFVLILMWKDPRLAGLDSEPSLVGCSVALGRDLGSARGDPQRPESRRASSQSPVRIEEGGVVRYAQRYQGELTAPLDLRDFPFDSQNLRLELVAAGYSPEEVEFVADLELGGRSENLTIADWSVMKSG